MSSPSVTRPKSSSMGTIVVDIGNHRGDADLLRLKSNNSVDSYSPAKKTLRPEPVSRIHCIPLLMVLVFFILWTASSEILPELKRSGEDVTAELLVVKTSTANKFATSEDNEISRHGTRTVLDHNNRLGSYLNGDGAHSLEYYRSMKRPSARPTFMRGTAR